VRSIAWNSFVLLCVAGCAFVGPAATPYATQETREIKSLSAEEVKGYLAGNGMGLAKPAELNGYPGPAHVLEMAGKIGLTAEQRGQTQSVFDSMQASAAALGRQLVEEERALDRLFSTRTASSASLAASLEKIAAIQAKLRGAHLEAHLAEAAILTAAQVEAYVRLRGYEGHHGR
jgi:Spy/CpxP family protein refolding chaperone